MIFYISADIEGVGGVVSHDQTMPGNFEWERARVWMTEEVLAAVEAAKACGIEDVVVSDSHANGQNILIDRLPPNVRLVRSTPRPLRMMQGVETPGVAACAFIGYHASSVHPTGLLAHTYSGLTFRVVRINGKPVSEAYANAALAGEFSAPLVALTGDADCIEEARSWCGDIETAATKTAHSRQSAITLTPEASRALVRQTVERGLRRREELRPLVIAPPIELQVEMMSRSAAEMLAYLPIFERLDAFNVRYVAGSMAEATRVLVFMSAYSGVAR